MLNHADIWLHEQYIHIKSGFKDRDDDDYYCYSYSVLLMMVQPSQLISNLCFVDILGGGTETATKKSVKHWGENPSPGAAMTFSSE